MESFVQVRGNKISTMMCWIRKTAPERRCQINSSFILQKIIKVEILDRICAKKGGKEGRISKACVCVYKYARSADCYDSLIKI
jgi:hypothetical protein